VISVALVTETGEKIDSIVDSTNLLGSLPSPLDGNPYRLLNYIDIYSDTIFNRMQIPDLIVDLDRLREATPSDEHRTFISRLEDMAERSLLSPHQFLKFIGE